MGTCIALEILAMSMFLGMRFYLQAQNKELARRENDEIQLPEDDARKLETTAQLESVDIDTARAMQKGYRYMI